MSKKTILTCDFCGRAEADVGLMISNQQTGAAICEHCVREASSTLMGTYIERDAQGRKMMQEAQAAQLAAAAQPAEAGDALEHQPALPLPPAAQEAALAV